MKKLIIILIIGLLLSPFAYKGARVVYYKYLHYKAKQLEGAKVDSINIVDTNGRKYNLKELKGKNIVLVFWASWCNYCVDEIPSIKKFYANKKDNTLLITASIDKNSKDALNAIKEHNMSYPVVIKNSNNSEFFSYFKITQVPSIWVIDKNGVIVAQNLLHISDTQKIFKK
jgi:thiol-disulfide isomerase/thioredoxin